MKIKEMLEFVQMLHDGYYTNYFYLALRFESKNRNVGDIITENSKHNADRSDERDFPEFGTPEYEELEELDGISAWVIGHLKNMYRYQLENDVESLGWKHAYFIGSDEVGYANDDILLDNGEILLKNAIVLGKIF